MKFKMSRKHLKFLSDWLDNPNNWNEGFDNHPKLLTEIRDIIYEQAYQTKIKRGMKGSKNGTKIIFTTEENP